MRGLVRTLNGRAETVAPRQGMRLRGANESLTLLPRESELQNRVTPGDCEMGKFADE